MKILVDTILEPLLHKNLLSYKIDDKDHWMEVKLNYFGKYYKKRINLNSNTESNAIICKVKDIIEKIILKHWCDNEPLATESHGNEGQVCYVSIPLNKKGTLNILASIDIWGDDDFYILDWGLEEERHGEMERLCLVTN